MDTNGHTPLYEDYVSFEIAKLLKEKGFDEECRAFWKEWKGKITLCHCCKAHMFEWCFNSMLERYNDDSELNVTAPTLQMAMKWLREVHKCCIVISPEVTEGDGSGGCLWGWSVSIYLVPKDTSEYVYESYEEACEAAIKYCLENLI